MEKKIGALTTRIGQINDEVDRLKDLLEPLRQKDEQSKIEPGPPLTDSERKTHAILSGMVLEEMTRRTKGGTEADRPKGRGEQA